MKRVWVIAVLGVMLAASLSAADCSGESYGAGVKISEATSVPAILDRPEEFSGKAVRIEGQVKAVCEHMGCWMEIQAADSERTLKVKVEDGEIVFPVSARGRRATAEGTVEIQTLEREQYLKQKAHEAEERGAAFDPATVGEGPFSLVQLRGTGALICAPEAGS